jgi:hypothetical protein
MKPRPAASRPHGASDRRKGELFPKPDNLHGAHGRHEMEYWAGNKSRAAAILFGRAAAGSSNPATPRDEKNGGASARPFVASPMVAAHVTKRACLPFLFNNILFNKKN